MKQKILVVDDEPAILELIVYNLDKAGYEVITAIDGLLGCQKAREEKPDLVVLDIMLPGMDGLEVCRQLVTQPETADIPILFLTARREEIDRIVGLEIGGDDYLTKPFSPREMVARIKAILRRTRRQEEKADKGILRFGDLVIEPERHEVTIQNRRVDLTAREFDLLHYLALHAGKVFSRESLLEKLWDYNYFGDARTVDVHIRHIREKIEPNPGSPEYILTVRGVGYKFKESRGT